MTTLEMLRSMLDEETAVALDSSPRPYKYVERIAFLATALKDATQAQLMAADLEPTLAPLESEDITRNPTELLVLNDALMAINQMSMPKETRAVLERVSQRVSDRAEDVQRALRA